MKKLQKTIPFSFEDTSMELVVDQVVSCYSSFDES